MYLCVKSVLYVWHTIYACNTVNIIRESFQLKSKRLIAKSVYDWSFISVIRSLFRLSQNKLYMMILILLTFDDKHSLTYSVSQSIVWMNNVACNFCILWKANRPTEDILGVKKKKGFVFICNVMKPAFWVFMCKMLWLFWNLSHRKHYSCAKSSDPVAKIHDYWAAHDLMAYIIFSGL